VLDLRARMEDVQVHSEKTFLRKLPVGARFTLCRTGERYELVAARAQTPSGYRRDCHRLSDGYMTTLHHACHVEIER